MRSLIAGLGSIALLGAIAFAQDTTMDTDPTAPTAGLQKGADAPALNLFDLKGQVFVLEFINPTDEGWLELHKDRAVRSDGALKEVHDKYAEEGVIWLAICPYEQPTGQTAPATGGLQGIARADRGELCRQVNEMDLGFPVLFDEGGRIASSFGVTQLPYAVVIDKEGKIAYTHGLRSTDGDLVGTNDFDRAIGAALNATGASTNDGSLPASSPRETEGETDVDMDDDIDVDGDVDSDLEGDHKRIEGELDIDREDDARDD